MTRNFGLAAVLGAAALLTVSCSPKPAADAAPADPGDDVNAIADAYLDAIKTIGPFNIVLSGLGAEAPIDNAAFDQNSPEALAQFEQTEDALLKRIAAIDPDALANRADWVAYQSIKESLESGRDVRICHSSWWGLNHMFGWQNSLPSVAAMQPVATEEDRAAALARWEKLPAYIAQERANLETGLANGYSVPKRIVARVLTQLDSLLAAPAASSPFIAFAAESDNEAFKTAAQNLAAEKIQPAIASFRAWLNDDYMPAARDDLAITALPDGAACYEALLRAFHSAQIGSAKTHERGLEAVAANKQSVIERGRELFGTEDFAEILARVKDAPGNRFESEEDVIDFTNGEVGVSKKKSAPFFTKLPTQELIVQPYADYLKGTGQSSRYEATPPSQGPATYRINTDEWATQTRGEAQIVAVHEGWPGHHMQIATAYAIDGLHPVVQLLGSSAYAEGWARYAEALAEEAGIYNAYGPISRRAWPARGMVLDTGFHAYGWSEEQTKAVAIESGRFDEARAEVLLDRIAVMPGQLTAYDTGGLEIFALRHEAEQRLGDKFDLKEFHDRILENGAVPLAAMRAHVEEWIAKVEAE